MIIHKNIRKLIDEINTRYKDGYIGAQIIKAFAELPVYEDEEEIYSGIVFEKSPLEEIISTNLSSRFRSKDREVDYSYNVAPNIVINLRIYSYSGIFLDVSIYEKDFASTFNCSKDCLAIYSGNVVGQLQFFLSVAGNYEMEVIPTFKIKRNEYGKYISEMASCYKYNFSSPNNEDYGRFQSSFYVLAENGIEYEKNMDLKIRHWKLLLKL